MSGRIRGNLAGVVLVSAVLAAGCHRDLKTADEETLLWPGGAPSAKGKRAMDEPRLYLFRPDPAHRTGVGAVVASGGSYGHHGGLSMEGVETAQWLADHGITALLVRYRVGHRGRYNHVDFIADGRRAVRTLRARADALGIDPDRLGMFGFSAGGHMAASIATGCVGDEGESESDDPIARQSCRLAFAVAVYPVITLDERWAHRRSKRNLLGGIDNPSAALKRELSVETRVSADTPPMLLVHSRRDTNVDPHNSVLFHEALLAAGGSSTLLMYDDGGHGVGLADEPKKMPQMSTWPEEALLWLTRIGVY